MVVSAQQSQIVKIGGAAEDPIQDVVSVAPLGWVSKGKLHPVLGVINAMVLTK